MDSNVYYEDGVARVLKLLQDTFGDQFKAYFDGEPENIPETLLPCLMVVSPRIEIESGGTGTDDVGEEITIIIALNKKDDLGAPVDADLTDFKLRKYIMGQDPTTKQYVEQSVMYAIRKHFTLGDAAIQNSVSIDMDTNVRGVDTVTREAIITLTITRLAFVPSRD